MIDTPASPARLAALEQARLATDQLRQAWSWLELLLVPGPETRPGRVMTDAAREELDAQAMAERAYRRLALREGRGALPSTAAPGRLAVAEARATLHQQVMTLARRLADDIRVRRPTVHPDVFDGVRDVLDWLDGTTGAVWVAAATGPLWPQGALDWIRDPGRVAAVEAELARLARSAERAAGVLDSARLQPLSHRCPACGRRSLQLDFSGDLRAAWSVRCMRRACVCTGTGCGCGQRVRAEGRQHAWPYGELSGPWGLWQAIERAALVHARPNTRVGSQKAGRGGW